MNVGDFKASMDAAAAKQMQIAVISAETSTKIAESNAVKQAYNKIQG